MVDSSPEELLVELNRKRALGLSWHFVATAYALLVWLGFAQAWQQWLMAALGVAGIASVLIAYFHGFLSKTTVLLYDLDSEVADAYEHLCTAGMQMATCEGIWHIGAKGHDHNAKYHAGAHSLIERQRATLRFEVPRYVRTNVDTLTVRMRDQTLHFFPDRVLIYGPACVTAVVYSDARIAATSTRFIENGSPPSDATVVDQKWQYVNKSGGPDQRFRDNRKLKVTLYGELTLPSEIRLRETIQLSRPDVAPAFADAVAALVRTCRVAAPKHSAQPAGKTPSGIGSSARQLAAPSHDAHLMELKNETLDSGIPLCIPPLALLDDATAETVGAQTESAEFFEIVSRQLEYKLKDAGISAEVVSVSPGPVVTRFELKLAPGVQPKHVTPLGRDITRWMAVAAAEVIEERSGKCAIEIEFTRHDRHRVRLSELLRSKAFDNALGPLPLAIGKHTTGSPCIAELSQMPNLLIADATCAGKTLALNAIILSLLYSEQSAELRFVMIDTTQWDLSPFDALPHLLAPVVTEIKEAAGTLRWCVAEAERRCKIMGVMRVRTVAGFNKAVRDAAAAGTPLLDPYGPSDNESGAPVDLKPLRYIIVVVTDFYDVLKDIGEEAEHLTVRLKLLSEAAGIHLIVLTQHISAKVLTPRIKSSFPTRVSFKTTSKNDSQLIFDHSGAETLGGDDMLYQHDSGPVERIHGAFASDEEVRRVSHFLRQVAGCL